MDEAVQSLSDLDQRAILLRYFRNKAHWEVAQELGGSEAAAKMRVIRAVDQLRERFGTKGIACTAARLTQWLRVEAVQSAPDTLVSKVSRLSGNPSPAANCVARRVAPTAKAGILFRALTRFSPTKPAFAMGLVGVGIAFGVRLWMAKRRGRVPVEATGEPAVQRPAASNAPREVHTQSRSIPGASMDPALLAVLKEKLRAMLKNPPVVRRHPPERLLLLLQRFAQELPAAIPILVGGLDAVDHETRLWALGGSGHSFGILAHQNGASEGDFTTAFAAVCPARGKIARDEDQSTQQRMSAFQTLFSPWMPPKVSSVPLRLPRKSSKR